MGSEWEKERQGLLHKLEEGESVKPPAVKAAFLRVPRDRFIPEDLRGSAYDDAPLPIGRGQTISAPSIIAIMLEEVELKPGERVLEIGAGCGYNAALLAEIVGQDRVVSVERIPQLAGTARPNLAPCGYRIEGVLGDGALGYPLKR